ncbi:MAG: SUMF1/EgtB/PvdO family nonheme iron enzyme, partial [Planctomycetota bacterium]
CNWLSQREGIPENQWAYLPNQNGEIGPGMKIAPDHLRRSGYQIPTPDLWEYACRGNTSTPRFYGVGTELSREYVRWSATRSDPRGHNGLRLPNAFGLFDMLGNSAEWSIGLVDRSMNFPADGRPSPGAGYGRPPGNGIPRDHGFPPGPNFPQHRDFLRVPANQRFSNRAPASFADDKRGPRNLSGMRQAPENRRAGLAFGGGPLLLEAAGKKIQENNLFVVLGGAFDSPAHKIRSSDRSIISPPITNKPLTLRLMRIRKR